MGDISMRGKGKALKMKKGGALPSNKGASKAGMQSKQGRNFLLPKEKEPKRFKQPGKPEPKPKRPKRPKPTPVPMPRPMPGPNKDRPNFRPMPDRRPRLPKDLEKYFMKTPRRVTPLKKKDGGEMKGIAGMFGKGAMGISAEKLKKAFEQAKKMKPTGRINTDDIKRALKMFGAAKKSEPKIKGRLGGPKKTTPTKRTKTLRRLI